MLFDVANSLQQCQLMCHFAGVLTKLVQMIGTLNISFSNNDVGLIY